MENTYAVMVSYELENCADQVVAVLGATSAKDAVDKAVRIGIMPCVGQKIYALPPSKWSKRTKRFVGDMTEFMRCVECGAEMRRWELDLNTPCPHKSF